MFVHRNHADGGSLPRAGFAVVPAWDGPQGAAPVQGGFSKLLRRNVMKELQRLSPQVANEIRRRPQHHFWREV